MRVLLLAMPDVASSFDRVMRMPNLGLVSLAANLEEGEARVLDLVLHRRRVGEAVRKAVLDFQPDLVGLSAMTFQYHTAKQVAAVVRATAPKAHTVLGGYHATLAYQEIAADPEGQVFDFLVRGEGEVTLNLLVRALREGRGQADIAGLSYRAGDAASATGSNGWVHNPPAPLLDLSRLQPPTREARLAGGFTYFGRRFDVVETSRGCTRSCNFCCIHRMYGPGYRAYPLARVIADIRAAAAAGAEGISSWMTTSTSGPAASGSSARPSSPEA